MQPFFVVFHLISIKLTTLESLLLQKIRSGKVLIVDNHRLFVESFTELLKIKFGMSEIDQCYSLEDANRKLLFEKYDYFFVDIMTPGANVKEYIEGFLKLNKD